MRAFSSILAGTYTSLCMPFSQCLGHHHQDKSRPQDAEKDCTVIVGQPTPASPLAAAAPATELSDAKTKGDRTHKRQRSSLRSSLSIKRRPFSNSSPTTPRRPQISGPTNFRHVHSGSIHASLAPAIPRHSNNFAPRELSFHQEDTRPELVPPSEPPNRPTTSPHPHNQYGYGDDYNGMTRSQSFSFHLPRHAASGGPAYDDSLHSREDLSPQPTRKRAYTTSDSPPNIMDDLVERVAQAMLERDQLQDQINDAIERQSLYTASRPGTAVDQQGMEPMPEVPAVPPNAPSFAERLKTPTPTQSPPASPRRVGRLPPPPLPLRLRPPLRKKKSFSRVSNWLGYQSSDSKDRHRSFDSVTNHPKPVKDSEGYYEIAQSSFKRTSHSSYDSTSSISDWSAEEEQQTLPTSWSPGSERTTKAAGEQSTATTSTPGHGLKGLRLSRPFVLSSAPNQRTKQQAQEATNTLPGQVGVAV